MLHEGVKSLVRLSTKHFVGRLDGRLLAGLGLGEGLRLSMGN